MSMEEVNWNQKCLIFDVGGYSSKIGRNYDKGGFPDYRTVPNIERRSIVGRYKRRVAAELGKDTEEVVEVGSAVEDVASYSAAAIMDHGVVRNWGDAQAYLNYMLGEEMGEHEDLSQHRFILPTVVKPSTEFLGRMAEIIFDYYQLPELLVPNIATLSLFGCGKTSGIAVEIGYGNTQCATMYDGQTQSQTAQCHALGGEEVSLLLRGLLAEHCSKLCSRSMLRAINDLVKTSCYYAEKKYDGEPVWTDKTAYLTLPDGAKIELNSELALATEVLFEPSLGYIEETPSVPDMIATVIKKSDLDTRMDLMMNVTITGGLANLPNCGKRFTHELSQRLPTSGRHDFSIEARGGNPAWAGGVISSTLSSLDYNWIAQHAWEEGGVQSLIRACF